MTEEKNLEGLGGWLILVGIGIVLSPIVILVQAFPTYIRILSTGAWKALTTPGAENYNALWAPTLIGEIAINTGLVLAWPLIAFLFFSKKKVFPKWYIGILVFILAFIIVDSLAVKLIFPAVSLSALGLVEQFIRSLITAAIWIPYMLISKRVKATFVK